MFGGKCGRCKEKTNTYIMSFFNTDMLCPDCADKERKHPLYEKAREVELAKVRAGIRDYKGIGLPDDLRPDNG